MTYNILKEKQWINLQSAFVKQCARPGVNIQVLFDGRYLHTSDLFLPLSQKNKQDSKKRQARLTHIPTACEIRMSAQDLRSLDHKPIV